MTAREITIIKLGGTPLKNIVSENMTYDEVRNLEERALKKIVKNLKREGIELNSLTLRVLADCLRDTELINEIQSILLREDV